MSAPRSIRTADGRAVRFFDTGAAAPAGPGAGDSRVLVWHHGTPQTGAVLEPVAAEAGRRGFRVISVARAGYPGSDELPGRSVADSAADVLAVLNELGVERFSAAGASGGGPHALACAALAPDRVDSVITLAGIAPYTGEPDWFSGMADPGGLRAALGGREDRLRHAESASFDPKSFTGADYATLESSWRSLGADAAVGAAEGPAGEADDDLAFVSRWGFPLREVGARVLLVQGGSDRVVPATHAALMLERLPRAELWLRPRDGHVSVLTALGVALDWVAAG